MRENKNSELYYLREKRPLFDKIIIWLFRGTINRITTRHLTRAYQVGDINSKQMHELDAYFGADLELAGI